MVRLWKCSSAVIVALLLLTILASTSSAASMTVYKTDFEGGGLFISDWAQHGWSRGDYAAGHEDDLWCRANPYFLQVISNATNSSIVPHSPTSALYCAKLGTNGQNGRNNVDNGYPDPGMDSWVRFAPPNASKYGDMTLTFWYWAKTGASGSSALTNCLWVNVNDGSRTTHGIWKQPSADSQGWRQATVNLPRGTIWMEWEFKANATIPPGGPFVGAFIDDVTLTAESVVAAPTSKVGSLNPFYNTTNVSVPFTMNDADHVALYYRIDNGSWTKFAGDSSDGQFASSPIPFQAPKDGRYDFFTVATGSGAVEDTKNTAEASTTIRISHPSLKFTTAEGAVFNSTEVAISWNYTGGQSNVTAAEVSMDGGAFDPISRAASSYAVDNLSEGEHSLTLRITDERGSTSDYGLNFTVDANPQGSPSSLLSSPLIIEIAALLLIAALSLAIVRRSRRTW